MKHLIELADLIAYENEDEESDDLEPSYIGHSHFQGKNRKKTNMATTNRIMDEDDMEEMQKSKKHFFVDKHGEVHETCTTNNDCEERNFVCGIDQPGVCGHKDVFPTGMWEMIGVFTFALVMGLCTVAGIGGGGIAISLIIAFFNFTTKPAVAISSLSILVCTTMRFFYNFKTMHPEKKGVILIDYSLVTIMMPTTIAGSQFGSIILKIFPALFIQVALTILLAALSVQSFRKANQLHKKEQDELAGAKNIELAQANNEKPSETQQSTEASSDSKSKNTITSTNTQFEEDRGVGSPV